MNKNYYVYIVSCSDGSFYTGYAADVKKRVAVHNTGKTGAKYTKTRRPVKLVYSEELSSKSEAMKREYAIKQLTHIEKKKLVQSSL
jgi:putative endonuclease